jgi:hypothetical protein
MVLNFTASEFVAVLAKAAASFQGKISDRPDAKTVVAALLEAERTAKQQRITYEYPNLLGRWRLCFATRTQKARNRSGISLGKGYYFPKISPAYLSFTPANLENQGAISNQIQLGLLKLRFSGLTKYLGKKNLLAFDFTRIEVLVLDRVLYSGEVRGGKQKEAEFEQRSIGTLPFFAFFLVSDQLIAARGRGGGLALWIREPG